VVKVNKCARATLNGRGPKKAKRYSNLKLVATSPAPALTATTFTLPKQLQVRKSSSANGKQVGTLTSISSSKKKTAVKLKMPTKAGKQTTLTGSGSTKVVLTFARRATIGVSGLPADTTSLTLKIDGKRTKLVKLRKSCSQLGYRGTLTDVSGKATKITSRNPCS
jgi:hypothetical protein